ncbi:YqzL family protein [Paenibacillus sp.]|uniref:YqzL family protein n=1 Tax=Paenibacillus sp. TaxID=58172 RepID=UPI002D32FFDD|nr:YqzL family protein [Paenibacillus sp.]HZG84681.1 YqzL family protein [Paenibacillus sp.]
MRDFSWTYFTLTGDVDAYMLYREWDQVKAVSGIDMDAIPGEDETEACYTE